MDGSSGQHILEAISLDTMLFLGLKLEGLSQTRNVVLQVRVWDSVRVLVRKSLFRTVDVCWT